MQSLVFGTFTELLSLARYKRYKTDMRYSMANSNSEQVLQLSAMYAHVHTHYYTKIDARMCVNAHACMCMYVCVVHGVCVCVYACVHCVCVCLCIT